MEGGPRRCAAQPAPSPRSQQHAAPAPAWHPRHDHHPPMKAPNPNTHGLPWCTRRVHNPQGTPQGATCGHLSRKPWAFACATGLWVFVLLQRLHWRGKGILGVTAPAPLKARAGTLGREHTHGWGGPWDPRAAPAAPSKPPAAEAVGHCGTWLPQLPLLAVTWSEPQPGGYFWLCITSQLTLPPCCRSPATYPHARPSSHARAPPATLGRPGCLRSTRQPHARRRGPASSAHRFASRRLAVMPGARSAGG